MKSIFNGTCISRGTHNYLSLDFKMSNLRFYVSTEKAGVKYLSKPLGRISEEEVEIHSFLKTAMDGHEWSTSCHVHLTQGQQLLYP
jgi:hypothetical protein